MQIAIDASSAFAKLRTGVEEYTYQILSEFKKIGAKHQFILYLNNNVKIDLAKERENWPKNFEFSLISSRRMVINPLLSLDLLKTKPDVLWIPAQVMPALYYPKNTIVSIHGLEYEHFLQGYTWQEKKLLTWSTKFAAKHSKKVIAVSDYTKTDLIKFYQADPGKISVVYNGFMPINNIHQDHSNSSKYILFIARLEPRKNVINLIKAFDLFKQKYRNNYELYLAGAPGYEYRLFKEELYKLKYKDKIKELGFVSEEEKHRLLTGASLFVFPSLAEGFGIPILEAMSAGCPVISSNRTSLPEIGSNACLYFDPDNISDIADKIQQVLPYKTIADDLRAKGYERIKQFSWQKCARETLIEIEETV